METVKQTYFKNGYILTMNDTNQVYANGELLVENDKIVAVGKVAPELVKPDAEVIDLNGRYILPGFVNTHVHTSQQISRGVGDDVDFITWLHKRMWPFESNMCDGKWLMRDRKILTLDEEIIVKEAQEHARAIYKRTGIVLPDRFPTIR